MLFLSVLTVFCINTNYICDNDSDLNIDIRNNINGDYIKVEKITDILPGSIISIKWKGKKIMLPYSPRKGFLSFSDLRWDWRYQNDENGEAKENNATLYEIISRNENIEHNCKISDLKEIS